MVLQLAANRDDVEKMAALRGFGDSLIDSLPAAMSAGTTGGGSVTSGASSTSVTAGATGGDTAVLNATATGFSRSATNYLIGGFSFPDGVQPTDTVQLGYPPGDPTTGNGIFYDATNNVLNSNGTTVSPTVISFDGLMNIIEIYDHGLVEGDVDFKIHNPVNGSETFNIQDTTVSNVSKRVFVESNGTGDTVDVQFWEEVWRSQGVEP